MVPVLRRETPSVPTQFSKYKRRTALSRFFQQQSSVEVTANGVKHLQHGARRHGFGYGSEQTCDTDVVIQHNENSPPGWTRFSRLQGYTNPPLAVQVRQPEQAAVVC